MTRRLPAPRLIVFARAPELGRVKTRLASSIGPARALEVYRRLLLRTLEMTRRLAGVEREWSVAGDDPEGECARLAADFDLRLTRQCGADLGERMRSALERALQQGRRPVLIGADSPDLDVHDLSGAFAALAHCDAVFSPTRDGGYALIGLRRPVPSIFNGPAWGSAAVMQVTRARLRHAGASWIELRSVSDLDTVEDLQQWPTAG